MNFPFFIARRYLFSKKRHNAINIISSIAVGGVALATMAMVCVLSGFNGFHDLIGGLFTTIDPQLEVVPTKGRWRRPTIHIWMRSVRIPLWPPFRPRSTMMP